MGEVLLTLAARSVACASGVSLKDCALHRGILPAFCFNRDTLHVETWIQTHIFALAISRMNLAAALPCINRLWAMKINVTGESCACSTGVRVESADTHAAYL